MKTHKPEFDSNRNALVVGATGIAGTALCRHLLADGWGVTGISRRSPVDIGEARAVLTDITDPAAVAADLSHLRPSHVFFTTWIRQDTEQRNIEVNSAIIRNVLDALRPAQSVRHTALLTGLKHYLGPFEAYGKGNVPDTPFHEDEPRLPYPNFYYAQEDALFSTAARDDFSWSVHRAHTIIGHATGNAMNMGQTLAVYAALCRETGLPFIFPGSAMQWNGLTDMTDANLLAKQLQWAAETPAAANTAFNIANGDVFRWRWLWPLLAHRLGVEAQGYASEPRPLEKRMNSMAKTWRAIAQRENLRETNMNRVASWWHTDSDLGREMECLTDMKRSRAAGFTDYTSTLDAFMTLFDTLEQEHIVPMA